MTEKGSDICFGCGMPINMEARPNDPTIYIGYCTVCKQESVEVRLPYSERNDKFRMFPKTNDWCHICTEIGRSMVEVSYGDNKFIRICNDCINLLRWTTWKAAKERPE